LTSPNRIRRHLALIVLGVSLAGAPSTSQVLGISLAWDASVDLVDNYIVYVGTESGVYDEFFDVGLRTSFTYRTTDPDRRYYFSVVAQRRARVSERAAEVSAVAVELPPPREGVDNQSVRGPIGRAEASERADLAVSCPNGPCYSARVRARGLEPVS
jgi:hypothetical protein